MVEALGQQRGGLRDGTLDHGDRVGVQILRQQPGHGGGGRGRQLAGLGDDGVARGQRAYQRSEQQLHRVVPGRDDEDHAQRVLHGVGGGSGECRRYGGGFGPQPALQPLQGVVDLADREVDLGPVGLLAALAEVGTERLGQLVTRLGEQGAQPPQLGGAMVEALGASGTEGGAEAGDDLGRHLGAAHRAAMISRASCSEEAGFCPVCRLRSCTVWGPQGSPAE